MFFLKHEKHRAQTTFRAVITDKPHYKRFILLAILDFVGLNTRDDARYYRPFTF